MNFKFLKKIMLIWFVMLLVPINAFYALPSYAEPSVLEKEKRHILKLETTYNTRDLGGYETIDGKVTKCGVFLRSDDTDELTERDIETLKNYGVKTVIDMRDGSSASKWPDKLSGVEGITYYHIDIAEAHRVLSGGYTKYLEYIGEGNVVKKLFDIIYEAEEGAILFHCVGGKDRAGFLSMLLLGLANVDAELITENYIVSYDFIKERPKLKK